ncbi:MAG: hypothetical protein AMDU4_FER2C00228G0001 [Ferroplasma sp. Type II]|uniref:DODA-type extradiol aromatic ring-opening family dioxygenase n=1 Tax=Ferroplasma sp. Type II TaxID=261388 RepID=UPI00038950C1|nr:hypothetical protein [Ferroplasma sp. Type II]EQB70698.1 MAG: hypothetical protein AMDU4_FER2C00228G0001 [Ferroplasma sp. Type II]
MALERLYVIPHGDEIIDVPNQKSRELRDKIIEVTRGDNSDSIIVLTPHGMTLSSGIPIINTENLHGEYSTKTVRLVSDHKTNKEIVRNIAAEFGREMVTVNFATSSGPLSVFPEDFGTIIPLTFFEKQKISIISQPRISDPEKLMRLGRNIWNTVDSMNVKISVIFSADQAHTHSKSGPYGYSEYAKLYENKIKGYFQRGSLSGIENMDQGMVVEAKPDSYWNMVILNGFLKNSGMHITLDYHYVENYFGMMLAHGIQ